MDRLIPSNHFVSCIKNVHAITDAVTFHKPKCREAKKKRVLRFVRKIIWIRSRAYITRENRPVCSEVVEEHLAMSFYSDGYVLHTSRLSIIIRVWTGQAPVAYNSCRVSNPFASHRVPFSSSPPIVRWFYPTRDFRTLFSWLIMLSFEILNYSRIFFYG